MEKIQAKRVMIAATGSNSGKTQITCALLWALKQRGFDPVSFKCGPDYIDPLFHKKILGIDSRNLDTFFAGTEGIQGIVAACKDRYAVIEGVMGLYDGNGPESVEGSCYEVARALQTPIILVADAQGVGRTILSMIKGILLDDSFGLIKGILLNRMSEGFYKRLAPVLEKELSTVRDDVSLLGFFPKNPEISIGSRHLGLSLPDEIADIRKKLSQAASMLEKSVNIGKLIAIMEEAPCVEDAGGASKENATATPKEDAAYAPREDAVPCLTEENSTKPHLTGEKLVLAVAYDDAFCFYYRDNLDLFRENDVEIRFFSPLCDSRLPEDCAGILLGGGYPEHHLPKLCANLSMSASIRNAIDRGIPSLAECGGFMYLHRSVRDIEGQPYEMLGVIDGECRYSGHLVRFGYLRIEAETDGRGADELCSKLVGMKGHEFHYYDRAQNGGAYIAAKPRQNKTWECMIAEKNGIWGFPHFYYRSNPGFIHTFIKRMWEVKLGEFE